MLGEMFMITNAELLKNYLTHEMEMYFYKKFKNEPQEYVKLKICELLKFLALSHHTAGNIPFNDEIDEVWHLWILQTVQYRELMDKLPGKKFINHCSNDYPAKHDQDDEVELNNQISFLVSYLSNFGNFTPDTVLFWPFLNVLMKAFSLDLDQLNTHLLSIV